MAINKVVVNTENGSETLIDLTKDSVTPSDLVEGVTAHDASGTPIVGTAKYIPVGQATLVQIVEWEEDD
jgi:hypothetical protein